jgi:hypothetical protein
MRILVSDQNFGDGAQLERRLAGEAGAELEVEECSSEDEVAAALARHRPDALLMQFARVPAYCTDEVADSALALLRGERPVGMVAP